MSELVEFPANATVPIFPLPGVVFFPHTLLPLHIFEPRYREMVADSLAAHRLIAMVLLKEGWEQESEGRPPVHPLCCMGKITREQPLGDGRWNIILIGMARVRILEEVGDKPYRQARIEVVKDQPIACGDEERDARRKRLIEAFVRTAQRQGEIAQALIEALGNIENLGILSDVMASALPLTPAEKQQLIEETNPLMRVERLLEHLANAGPPPRGRKMPYPPPLNPN